MERASHSRRAALTSIWGQVQKKYCKVFDQDGKSFTLEEGQIALSKAALDRNKLEIGDTLILRSGI